jgi:putative transcriptional regulator
MMKATSLQGKVLIAMPSMEDANFGRSLVFMCAHTDQGAMGLIINKAAPLMSLADLLSEIKIKHAALDAAKRTIVRLGGPVEQFRGFVLHSCDYAGDETSITIGNDYRLSVTRDVLEDIAKGQGPDQLLVALGYAGWTPGQLENELLHNGWLHCDADEELIFGRDLEAKYNKALAKIGVDPRMLSGEVGHG